MIYDKKKVIKVTSIAVLLMALGFLWFNRNSVNFLGKKQSENSQVANNAPDDVGEDIMVQVGDIYQRVALPSGAVSQPTALERNDFSGFAGLPGLEDKEFYENYSVIYTEDKNKAVLASFVGLQEKKNKQKEFSCNLVEKRCTQEKLFFNDFKAGEAGIVSSSVQWLNWHSQNKTVIGITADEINGGALAVCDSEKKTCAKNTEDKLIFPQGAINSSVNKIIAIKQNDIINEKTGDKWELFLYDINDVANPSASYDISEAIDRDEDLVYDGITSVAWSSDDKTILIGTLRNIFKFDLGSGKLEKIFTDVSAGEEDVYWNSDALRFSPSKRYVIFVDTLIIDVANEDGEESESAEEGILKIIDLGDNNRVMELLQAEDLTLQ